MKNSLLILAALGGTSALTASVLTVGPDYHRPDAPVATVYRDSDYGAWKTAAPADAATRGEWWRAFGDQDLNALEARALTGNQSLHASVARMQEARAAAGLARSAYWPSATASGNAVRAHGEPLVNGGRTGNGYGASLDASWEIDLFGRVRRFTESARAEADAAASATEAVRLAVSAEVAAYYFSLRTVDEESTVVAAGLTLREETKKLAQARYEVGAADELDLTRADAELALIQAEAASLASRRSAFNNALAVLIGEPAPSFSLAPRGREHSELPNVPAGLPAALLERRPDVAAAERGLAAANARIGVAKAAFFPAISLTGGAGYASGDIDQLFRWDHRVWSIGPSVYLPIFQGGRNRANLERSRAAYDEAVANYRERVLVAFKEVQDALTTSRLLLDQEDAQLRAVKSAQRAAELARIRYEAGYVSYLDVIQAERTALDAQRGATQIAGQRWLSRVALIKALGGTWETAKEKSS